jgi:hypothetical protein
VFICGLLFCTLTSGFPLPFHGAYVLLFIACVLGAHLFDVVSFPGIMVVSVYDGVVWHYIAYSSTKLHTTSENRHDFGDAEKGKLFAIFVCSLGDCF